MKLLILITLLIGLGGCVSAPERSEGGQINGEGGQEERNRPILTTLGYTLPQARENMALNPNPYDISISECYSMEGHYIPELNQLRMRLINDYTSRAGKKFIEQYNHQTLYPRTLGAH